MSVSNENYEGVISESAQTARQGSKGYERVENACLFSDPIQNQIFGIFKCISMYACGALQHQISMAAALCMEASILSNLMSDAVCPSSIFLSVFQPCYGTS